MKAIIGTIVIAGLILGTVADIQADSFVSFNGQFHITYPDTWAQVDFQTADYYLSRTGQKADYEAVFTERSRQLIFEGQYLILTVDTVGSLTTAQLDSVLEVMTGTFGRYVVEASPADFLTTVDSTHILIDRENSVTAVISQIAGGDAGPRINLMAMKFYEGGIANFFFYSPAAEFEVALPSYLEILRSFSTENLDEVLRTDPPPVADTEHGSNLFAGKNLLLFSGLAMILIIMIASRKRKKRSEK